MQQHLLTEVYGLIFLLLIVGALFRLIWRQSKHNSLRALWTRTLRALLWYPFRLGVTAAVAFAIVAMVAPEDDSRGLVWIVLWPCLYWLWKFWDWRRKKGVAKPASELTPAAAPGPQALPKGGRPQSLLRKTVAWAAGVFVFIASMLIIMVLCLRYYESQVKAERDKVQIGMTADQVLPLVHDALTISAQAVLPENVTDQEGVHYASLMQHDGKYSYFGASDHQFRQLTDAEAAALMKQKMSDGYEWRWRCTFINDTPMHFSFTVIFGRDGRVKNVTEVMGWD